MISKEQFREYITVFTVALIFAQFFDGTLTIAGQYLTPHDEQNPAFARHISDPPTFIRSVLRAKVVAVALLALNYVLLYTFVPPEWQRRWVIALFLFATWYYWIQIALWAQALAQAAVVQAGA